MSGQILLQNGTVLVHQADDSIKALSETDVLVERNRIAAIGKALDTSTGASIIDCTGKILSPGFVDTHHHVWQTQLKGRHADEELLAYFTSGNLQSYNYTPHDIFYGQLTGALEALDSGTTTILDHAHGCYTPEHAQRAIDATIASGIRSVFALSPVTRFEQWDQQACVPSHDIFPDWILSNIERWSAEGGHDGINGRVHAGLGFDLFFLPKEMIQSIWARVHASGAKLITSHVCRNAVFGQSSTVQLLNDYDLLKQPPSGDGVRWVISHGNRLSSADVRLLAQHNIYISTTPESEAQMGLGNAMALEPHVKGCLGVDCHTNNTSSILQQARTLLQLKRQETNAPVLDKDCSPKTIRGTTIEAFNLATINGARAMGMQDEIGSLAVGKRADIVIFDYDNSIGMLCAGDYDPLVSVVRHSDVRDIDMVIVDGVIRKRDGKLVIVEVEGEKLRWKEIAKRTRASQIEVQKRIAGSSREKAREVLVGMFHIDETKLVDVA